MNKISIVVHRIDADPVDRLFGPAWQSASQRDPSISKNRWIEILSFLPQERLRTHVSTNHEAWPSASEFLAAMEDSPETAAMLEHLSIDGWVDKYSDWIAAEIEEADLMKRDGITMLKWRRPLVRLGAHVEITGEIPERMMQQIKDLLDPCLPLSETTNRITFVISGMRQDIERTIAEAFNVATDRPVW